MLGAWLKQQRAATGRAHAVDAQDSPDHDAATSQVGT
jgi:hypothetical protein